jgi:hypothetical protein
MFPARQLYPLVGVGLTLIIEQGDHFSFAKPSFHLSEHFVPLGLQDVYV